MGRLGSLRGSPQGALMVVALALFTDMLLYGLVVPILPRYAQALGASDGAIGVLFASYPLALLVATPVAGILADRVGRRTPMLWGLVGLALATVAFAFAASYPALLAARLLQGVAAAPTWTAGLALLADAFPARERGQAMGTALTGMTAGMLVGPPFGGALFERAGYQVPFLLTAALALVAALAVGLLVGKPARQATERLPIRTLLRDRAVLVTAGASMIGAVGLSIIEPVLPLDLERRLQASPSTIGLLFALATLAYGLSAPVVGALAERWGRRPTMALGLGALAFALPAVALPGSLWLVAVAMAALGVAASLALAPTLAELAAAVDRRGGGGYGAVYAIFNDAYAVGLTIGPLAGGFLAGVLGLGGSLALVGVAGALYAPLLVFGVPGDAESPAEKPK